jgi:hypothetical protein
MKKIYKLRASASVVCRGERKARRINKELPISESMAALPQSDLEVIIETAFEASGAYKYKGDLRFTEVIQGYEINEIQYWAD